MILPTRKSGYFFALKKNAIIQADSQKGIKKRDLIHSTQEGMIKLNTEFIYLLAILFDEICCSYHNVAGFDFKFGNIDIFSEFRKTYAKITEIRKEIKDEPLQ